MHYADLANGAFEFLGSLFILNHCRTVLKDKTVAGVSIVSTVFFALWGVWNIYYYPSLGQWVSFTGGLCIAAANAYWISLLLKYRNTSEHKRS